jgi:hypothetical protein
LSAESPLERGVSETSLYLSARRLVEGTYATAQPQMQNYQNLPNITV